MRMFPSLAELQARHYDCTKRNHSRHELQQIDVSFSDISVVANKLKKLRGIKVIPSHPWDVEAHTVPMLCARINVNYDINRSCLPMHPPNGVFIVMILHE